MNNEFPKNYKARFLLDLYMSNNYMPLSVEDDDREITDSPEFTRGEDYNLRSIEYRINDLLMVFIEWIIEHPEWTEEKFLEKRGKTIKNCQEAIETGLFCMRKNRIWYHKAVMIEKREKAEKSMNTRHEKIIDIDLPMHPSHLETMRWEMLGRKEAKKEKQKWLNS